TGVWHAYPQSERLLGDAGLVRLDHRRIADDDLKDFFGKCILGAGGRDYRPVLVSPEVGERDSARRFQRVLVFALVLALRVKDRAAEGGKQCRNRNDGKGRDMSYGGARSHLLFLLYLRQRFRHKFSHGVLSFTKKLFKTDQLGG